jgi:heme/copper-type cytochrome/quinol oxidase subunit 2
MRSARLARALILFGVLLTPAWLPAEGPLPAAAPPVTIEAGPDGIQRVTIILDSYSYTPNHLIVQAGKPVELTLTSVTTIVPHNFVLNDPASGLTISEDISAGKTGKITFTPTQNGTFLFFCDRKLPLFPSHRAKGMEGKLEVQ